jgi:hypothetical protein
MRAKNESRISLVICALGGMAYDAACAQITALLQATMQPNQRVIEEATAHLAQAETQPGTMSSCHSFRPLASHSDTHRSRIVRPLIFAEMCTGYGVVLSIILGRRDIDEHTRQAAGVHLKRYCAQHWPADAEDDEEFVAPTASEADRAQIRHLLPQILVDPSSKLRTAAVCGIVSLIVLGAPFCVCADTLFAPASH